MRKLLFLMAILAAFEAGRIFEAVVTSSLTADTTERMEVEVDQLHWDLTDIARAIRESR